MKELDRRYTKKLQRLNSCTPSKQRVVGQSSTSQPPPDAPKWSVDCTWTPTQGVLKIELCMWFFKPYTFTKIAVEEVDNDGVGVSNSENGKMIRGKLVCACGRYTR